MGFEAPPTPAGLLVDEWSGQRHTLDRTILIGTDPGADADVQLGAATMIKVEGADVDGVQVRVRVGDPEVTAESVGSGQAWIQPPGQGIVPLGSVPQPLYDGARLQVGNVRLVYRSYGSSR